MSARRLWLLGLMLLTLGALPALAEPVTVKLTAAQLREKGINTFTFRPVAFTSDGLTLVAQEKTNPEERVKGKFYRLWMVSVSPDGKLSQMRSVDVPAPSVEALALTPDDSTAILCSQAGATFLRVPLDGSAVSTLMEHRQGQAGFRASPSYLRPIPGELLTQGYFYDKEDFTSDTALASLNARADGVAAFQQGANIQKAERALPGFYASTYTSATSGFQAAKEGNLYVLYWWQDGSPAQKVDEADKISSLWGAGNRVVYAVQRGENGEAVVYDAGQDKKVVLGSGKRAYAYPFLSDDGRTAVVCQLDLAEARMSVFAAQEKDSWQLKPVAALQKVKMGAIRLAPNGRFLAFYNGDFLQFVELP